MKLYLLRHGETIQNRDGILQGQQPGNLSTRGIEQAKRVADYLKSFSFHKIYCSDLQRTRDTLAPILTHHTAEVSYTPTIRERSFGTFEGSVAKDYLSYVASNGHCRLSHRPEEGESYVDMQERLRPFLQELSNSQLGKNVLLCTHGGTIRAALSLLLERPLEEMLQNRIDNTSLSIVEYCPESGTRLTFSINETPHLSSSDELARDAALDTR